MLKLEMSSPVSHEKRLPDALYVPQGRDFEVSDLLRVTMARMMGQSVPELGVQHEVSGVATGGFNQFGLSPVTERTVQSAPFVNCLNFAAVGESLHHEQPTQLAVYGHFTPGPGFDAAISLEIDTIFAERVQELRNRTRAGTRDILITGGELELHLADQLQDSVGAYLHTLALFERGADMLEVEARVLQPAHQNHHRYATLYTQERRLVVLPVHRPQMFLPPRILPVLGRAVEVRQSLQYLLTQTQFSK